MVAGAEEPVGQLAVVGQQQQALGVLVQPSHRRQIDAAQLRREKLQHRGLAAILGGGQHPSGLVQQDVGVPAEGQRLAADGEGGGSRVVLLLGGGGGDTVDQHPPLPHQLLGLPARPTACGGQELIQTFHGVSSLRRFFCIIAYSGRNGNR